MAVTKRGPVEGAKENVGTSEGGIDTRLKEKLNNKELHYVYSSPGLRMAVHIARI